MKIDNRAFGIAAGITAAALSAICWTVLAIAPGPSMKLFGMMTHVDLTGLVRTVSVASLVVGVVGWGVGAGLVFGFGGWIYNRFQTA